MSRSSAAKHGDGAAPVPWASAWRASRMRWPRGTGCARRCRRHGAQQRVAHQQALRHRRTSSQRIVNATTSPRGLRATRNAPGTSSHQARTSATSSGGSCRAAIASIASRSSGPGGLDRVVLDGGGEERLAHERLVDERDHVGERGPARRPGRAGELAADLPPGRAAVGAVAHRVGRAQQRGDGLPDGVVDDQALAPELDERQRREPRERRLRRLVRAAARRAARA